MRCSDKIIQGTTGPIWQVTVPEIDNNGLETGADADLTNYTCSIKVGTQTATVTQKDATARAFLVQIKSTLSALLEPGGYLVGIEVRDDTQSPPYVSEIHRSIQIKPQLV